MLKIHALTLGLYQTNTYIIHDEASSSCCVIDPGYEAATIADKLDALGLTLDAILLTHGHFDHVGAVKELVKATGCALWIHEGDYSQPLNPTLSRFYPLANSDFTEIQFCEEGQVIAAGGLEFSVWSTPGHTWGSVCYACKDALFTGDTLFAGSCGRIDLPGGDYKAMLASLARLASTTADYRVYPGHGGSSLLSREQQTNPYLRGEL